MLFERAHGHVNSALVRNGLAGLALAGAVVACKPTAIISKRTHDLSTVGSPGAVGSQCTETSTDVRPVLRFTLDDTNNDAIIPGSRVGSELVTLGENFRPEHVNVVNNTGTLFPAPDVACPDGALVGDSCPDATLAAAGFSCQPISQAAAGDSQAAIVCALPSFAVEISPNATLEFVGSEVQEKAVLLLVANGGSMFGVDPDGNPNRRECSSDPDGNRGTAASLLLTALASGENPFVEDTELCVGTFRGSEPDYQFPIGGDVTDCFQPTESGTEGNTNLSFAIGTIATTSDRGGRNPWGAVIDGAERFNEWASPGQERHIVLVTDGITSPDVLATAQALGATFDGAQQAALNNEVQLHVVELDRRDRGVSSADGSAVACEPAVYHGANEEFARLACATGGNYAYVESGADLLSRLEDIARSVPGRYEMEMVADGLATLPPGPYKLDTSIGVQLLDSEAFVNFSATGATDRGLQDTRLVLMNRAACTAGSCAPGYVCDESASICRTTARLEASNP